MKTLDVLKTVRKTVTLRLVLRTSGALEQIDKPVTIGEAQALIKAQTLDTVLLTDRRHVMLVDDSGHDKALPVNQLATSLYLDRCYPGTTHEIRGDVVLVPDSDFSGVSPW